MKSIGGKLLVYFLIFVLLFETTAIFIFYSSTKLSDTYHESLQRFLLLNSISQDSGKLYVETKGFITDQGEEQTNEYFMAKRILETDKEKVADRFQHIDKYEMKNYINLIETFIHESELTVGFVIMDDIEQYTEHLQELRNASEYIQETTLEIIDMELTAYQSLYLDLQQRNEHFFIFIIFLFVTTLMVAIFFAIRFSKGITNPIHQLSRAAKEVSKGDLVGEPIVIDSNDELKLLGDTFNSMRSNIHELVVEIKDQSELDRLIKEMELKHLQNQINPHFLFNTLNTMSKMAYLEEANMTSNLIQSVASLLRHSLGDINQHVSLEEEVQVVKDYFQIQQTRFSERIQFDMEIEDDCLIVEVPQLTLQPLVENAFIHGIEEKEEGGRIVLCIYEQEDNVIIEVKDDGIGMTQREIERILTETNDKEQHVGHSTGIGLRNVIRRLQLFFQVQNVVEIESDPGRGTTIRLILPHENDGRCKVVHK